ncbi:MAG: FkbM family methyltransferase [Bacteroidota bacterium]
MKKAIQFVLQRLLGFERYLFIFALFTRAKLRWDRKEGHFMHFLTLLTPEDTVLDIGANIGVMTSLLAKTCKKGHVFAIEPVPENLNTLQRMVQHFRLRNVSILPIALGDKADTVQISMPVMQGVRMQGLSHVSSEPSGLYNTEVHSYEVEQMALDEMEEFSNRRIAAIKMDVENYEFFVLRGGRKLLSEYKPIIYCELWDNENRQKVFSLLEELGYACKVFIGKELVSFSSEIHHHQNFFFLPS